MPENKGLEESSRLYGVDIRALPRRFRGETGENKVPHTVEWPTREMLQRLGSRPEIHALNKVDVRARFLAMRGRGNGRLNAPRPPFFTTGVGEFFKGSLGIASFIFASLLIGAGIVVLIGGSLVAFSAAIWPIIPTVPM